MRVRETPLIPARAIQRRVAELAVEISERYQDGDVLLIPVLKGGCVFATDLMRHLPGPVRVEFVRARSYRGTLSTGTVEFTVLPECSVAGQDVLIVEDILDTGHTAAAIVDRLAAQRPRSLALCTLLDKPARRVREVWPNFVGFTISDNFVVGYGLDYGELYRNLPAVHVLDPE
jgi:hypoxanthine phosphoribosyltransferase